MVLADGGLFRKAENFGIMLHGRNQHAEWRRIVIA